jgi:hypothetical protein
VAFGDVLLVALAWLTGKLATLPNEVHLTAQSAERLLRAHLAIMHPYAGAATALGDLPHLVVDALTGPIPWGGRSHIGGVALAPPALPIRSRSSIETSGAMHRNS